MADIAPTCDFRRALEFLRGAAQTPTPNEIAELAKKTNASVEEALDAIQNFSRTASSRSRPQLLAELVAAFGRKLRATCILETGDLGTVLTSRLLTDGSGVRLTYVTSRPILAEVLPTLLGAKRVRVVASREEVGAEDHFPLVVAQPRIGGRSLEGGEVDRFGGETVRQLLPHLAEDGMLVWVTMRGVYWDLKSRESISNMAAAGWCVSGIIDLPSGDYPLSDMENVAVFLRRSGPRRKLVGALRDTDAVAPIAAALLSDAKIEAPPSCAWLEPDDQRSYAVVSRDVV